MTDSFAADVQQIQKYSEHWKQQAGQVGKLPAQLSEIESRLGAVLRSTFATDALNVLVGGSQLNNWFDLRAKLQDSAGKLDALTKELSQASENLRACSVAYQVADLAAADGFSNVYTFVEEQRNDKTPVEALLLSLTWYNPVSYKPTEASHAEDDAQQLLADSPSSIAKKLTDTGPDFDPTAHEENQPGYTPPAPTPAPNPDAGGGQTVLG